MNSFGQILRLTTFGESHGKAMGGILDGVPPGYALDFEKLHMALSRRRPGVTPLASGRRESDAVEILSGIMDGCTLGTPIGFIIPNTDAKSRDYDNMRGKYRPNHADYTYQTKYGIRDWRGGGRASARETVCRVTAGNIAAQILATHGITVSAWTSAIGDIVYDGIPECSDAAYTFLTRCPDHETDGLMAQLIENTRRTGDSIGGRVRCSIMGVPAGLGQPIYDKLQCMLAQAMMSIPAVKCFEYGQGRDAASCSGRNSADVFIPSVDGTITTVTNYSGGIQGGISNGRPLELEVTFKATPTYAGEVITCDIHGKPVTLKMTGRHDPCVVPRAVSVVESMAALTILDAMLLHRTTHLK